MVILKTEIRKQPTTVLKIKKLVISLSERHYLSFQKKKRLNPSLKSYIPIRNQQIESIENGNHYSLEKSVIKS